MATRSKTSQYGTAAGSLQTPTSAASLSRDTPKGGAYHSHLAYVASSHKSNIPGPPLEISTMPGNKHKLFIAPDDDTFDGFCFSTKGSGGDTFCTNLNCKIVSHKSKSKFKVDRGDIFLEKATGAAFARVFLNSSSLDPSLLKSWETTVNSMED